MLFRRSFFAAALAACAGAQAYDYPGFGGDTRFLQRNGAAAVVGDTLELTPSSPSLAGSAFDRRRIPTSGFSAFFSFVIDQPAGQLADCLGRPPLGGDGLTFTLHARSPRLLGAAGLGLGYQGIRPSVAVEFDTYCNANRNDPGSNHVAILTAGSTSHPRKPPSPREIEAQGLLADGLPWNVWVDYDARSQVLAVRTNRGFVPADAAGRERARPCTTTQVLTGLDLAQMLGTAQTPAATAFAGFTAANGDNSARHVIRQFALESQPRAYTPCMSLDAGDDVGYGGNTSDQLGPGQGVGYQRQFDNSALAGAGRIGPRGPGQDPVSFVLNRPHFTFKSAGVPIAPGEEFDAVIEAAIRGPENAQ